MGLVRIGTLKLSKYFLLHKEGLVCICDRMRLRRIKEKIFTRIFKVFTKFVKTLKIQVKFILNFTRTQCDYLFITQRVKFSENFPCTLKHKQPALRIKVPARKQFTKQAF